MMTENFDIYRPRPEFPWETLQKQIGFGKRKREKQIKELRAEYKGEKYEEISTQIKRWGRENVNAENGANNVKCFFYIYELRKLDKLLDDKHHCSIDKLFEVWEKEGKQDYNKQNGPHSGRKLLHELIDIKENNKPFQLSDEAASFYYSLNVNEKVKWDEIYYYDSREAAEKKIVDIMSEATEKEREIINMFIARIWANGLHRKDKISTFRCYMSFPDRNTMSEISAHWLNKVNVDILRKINSHDIYLYVLECLPDDINGYQRCMFPNNAMFNTITWRRLVPVIQLAPSEGIDIEVAIGPSIKESTFDRRLPNVGWYGEYLIKNAILRQKGEKEYHSYKTFYYHEIMGQLDDNGPGKKNDEQFNGHDTRQLKPWVFNKMVSEWQG